MADRFPLDRIPKDVQEIAATLTAAGHDTWYVGGAVRDALIESARQGSARAGDFDIATSALPQDVQKLFRRTVPVGIEHGTVAVLDDQNRAHEVTTFRRDVKTDGRHAVVEFGASLEDDLARRDFTINAIAVNPSTGDIVDPFEGREDLGRAVIRAVGDPETRFREDRLRVLRALRFAAAFDFAIVPETWSAVRASSGELGHLSRERVRSEWTRTLASALPSRALTLWRDAGVLAAVWPEFAALPADEDPAFDAIEPRDPVLLTAAAMVRAGVDAKAAELTVRRMKFSNDDMLRIAGAVSALSGPLPAPDNGPALRRWMSSHRAAARDAAAINPAAGADALRRAVAATFDAAVPLSIGDLAVRGDDLSAQGIKPGPRMGEVLRALLDAVLENPALNTKEILLARARAVP